ncbi:TolB family protein [Asanoa iriomotensis]|uniref:WD40 repeat protein n=1 Tax=Asanoa iriomotensis TaxID=234613 RepID=A0ABQ4C731_9ACTN|nr:hypothetical protein [Asanoa iriomotensis]GIF58575.1 hypothetical protein Air01nite_46700 [Asanoa iriomotensis]
MNTNISRRALQGAAACLSGAALLLTAACGTDPASAGSPAPASVPPVAAPSASPSTGGSVTGLPGWLYYADSDRLVRLTGSRVDTVLKAGAYSANVSPDGASIAFVESDGDVVVTDRDGRDRRTVLRGSVGVGFEPAWSADSRRLLVAKSAGAGDTTMGVVTVESGVFTALPHQLDGIHYLWSADGEKLGFATGTCQIGTADADGGNARLVPVFGHSDPQRRSSCDPFSISPDGRLMAVNQRTGDEPDGDIGRDLFADAVIEVATGGDVGLPVSGAVTAVLFQPNGDTLVRTDDHKLTLLGPDRNVKAEVTEPASVRDLSLLAYSAN